MSTLKRFPGVGEGVPSVPIYGRDALFLADRLRKDFWRRHKEREELKVYKDRIAQNQKRAEHINEVRRIEGFLQHNLTEGQRKAEMGRRQEALMRTLGMTALPE